MIYYRIYCIFMNFLKIGYLKSNYIYIQYMDMSYVPIISGSWKNQWGQVISWSGTWRSVACITWGKRIEDPSPQRSSFPRNRFCGSVQRENHGKSVVKWINGKIYGNHIVIKCYKYNIYLYIVICWWTWCWWCCWLMQLYDSITSWKIMMNE